jgi:plastocyanin
MLRIRSRAMMVAAAAAIALTACGGDDNGADNGADDNGAATAGGGGDISVTGLDTLEWDTETLEAEAGEITVELICEDAVNHNFVIDETDEEVVECAPGETATGTVELEPGEYTYVCTIPGHESRMRGTLEVS